MSISSVSGRQVGLVPEWTLGDRLKKARELTGLDQIAFAAELEIGRGTVVNYELGHVQPRAIVVRAWAMATGVNRVWLETGKAPSDDGADPNVRPEGFEPPTY